MRAALYETFGDPTEVLHPGDRPMPEPAAGQVRIKMTRAVIHNHDLWTVRGGYGVRPPLPAIGGSEAAGTVDALGEGVKHLSIGQRVTGFAIGGAWADYYLAHAAGVVPLPDAISDDEGCQLVAMPLSAMALLRTYKVESSEFLIQNAANGAVGKTLATLAKAQGTNVLNLVRSASGVRELESVGIAGAIATDQENWRDQVRAAVGKSEIAYGIESIGGPAAGEMLSLLKPGGTLVAFGSMSGERMEIDSGDLIFRDKKVVGFWLSKVKFPPAEMTAMVGELVKLVATGAIKLPVAGVFGLDQAKEGAIASLGAGRNGKVLFRP